MNSSQKTNRKEISVGFFNAHLVNLLNKLESSTMSLDTSICIVFTQYKAINLIQHQRSE